MSDEQRTAVYGTKKQLADALHTVMVERDAWRKKAEFFIVQYQDEIGINGLKEERDAAVAERDALQQALAEARREFVAIRGIPNVSTRVYIQAGRALVRIEAILRGDQGAEVAAAIQEIAKRGIIKGGDNG